MFANSAIVVFGALRATNFMAWCSLIVSCNSSPIYFVIHILNYSINLRWIIGQVQEETYIFHGTIFFKILLEKSGNFHIYLLKKCEIKQCYCKLQVILYFQRSPKKHGITFLGHRQKAWSQIKLCIYNFFGGKRKIPPNIPNQRTNGPVNAHLISWPSKAQNIQNLEKYRVKK